MFKGLISEVAKDAGRSAALIINQLFQWYKGSNSKKIYRTNQELHDDLCGIMSTATIQRCKKRLIEKGYIEVSFDKGLNRVTHYSLTKKALELLDSSKTSSEAHSEKKDGSGTVVPHTPETKPYHANNTLKSNVSSGVSESMKKSFEEQGKPRSNVVKGIPDALKNLIIGKKQQVVEEFQEEEDIPQNEYDECDIAMLNSLNNPTEHGNESLTLPSLVGTVFKQGASEERKKLYQMSKIQYRFSEDY